MIEATNVTFGYERGRPVIERWSAEIRGGEMVAITGVSGRGKSTLLYLLGTLVQPWSGSLLIGGRRVDQLSDSQRSAIRARLVGFVFQDALLDARRGVLDNVIEGAVYRGADRSRAGQRARELLNELGVDVNPSRRARDLSGGQAQRVGLCRALVGAAPILLADEPTGNLDAENARIVAAMLTRHARQGGAVVVATHDQGFAAQCDRVVQL